MPSDPAHTLAIGLVVLFVLLVKPDPEPYGQPDQTYSVYEEEESGDD